MDCFGAYMCLLQALSEDRVCFLRVRVGKSRCKVEAGATGASTSAVGSRERIGRMACFVQLDKDSAVHGPCPETLWLGALALTGTAESSERPLCRLGSSAVG